jgi:hypothetical protein
MKIIEHILKSNGFFSIVKAPYAKNQHPNQQGGLDRYIDVLDHDTGNINSVKLYENTKGIHFKKQGTWYLSEFTKTIMHVPFQIHQINR